MRKSFLIIFGIISILTLVAVWAYLMFVANPEENTAIFGNFGGDGEELEPVPIDTPSPDFNEENYLGDIPELEPLRQLTLRPVAGFNEVVSPDGTLEIYFVEMGTGHLFAIDKSSGVETRLSGTTIPQTKEAYISDDGTSIAIAVYNNTKVRDLLIYKLDRENNSLIEVVSDTATDLALKNNSLYFTKLTPAGLEAYVYPLDTLELERLFKLPFNEATIVWHKNTEGPHYVYPKASYALPGFLYRVDSGRLTRLPLEGFGFSALASSDTIIFTKISDDGLTSHLYNQGTGEVSDLAEKILPEKCLFIEYSVNIICPVAQNQDFPYKMPDTWYQGKLSLVDSIIEIDPTTNTSYLVVDVLALSGRAIDIQKLSYNEDFSAYFFTNKNDNSLWVYEIID